MENLNIFTIAVILVILFALFVLASVKNTGKPRYKVVYGRFQTRYPHGDFISTFMLKRRWFCFWSSTGTYSECMEELQDFCDKLNLLDKKYEK